MRDFLWSTDCPVGPRYLSRGVTIAVIIAAAALASAMIGWYDVFPFGWVFTALALLLLVGGIDGYLMWKHIRWHKEHGGWRASR
jgi:hypothetical protein